MVLMRAGEWVSKNEIKTWMIIIITSHESIETGAKIGGETHIEWIWTSSDSIKINGKPQQTLSNAHIGSHIYSDNAMKRSERNQKKDTWTSALQGAFFFLVPSLGFPFLLFSPFSFFSPPRNRKSLSPKTSSTSSYLLSVFCPIWSPPISLIPGAVRRIIMIENHQKLLPGRGLQYFKIQTHKITIFH